MKKRLLGTVDFNGETLLIHQLEYHKGRPTAITLTCDSGELYAHLSINIPNISNRFPKGCFVVHHDMTRPGNKKLFEALFDRFFEDTGNRIDYGYVREQPIWRIKEET